MSDDRSIMSFMQIANVDLDTAKLHIDQSGGNLETALATYFQGRGSRAQHSSPPSSNASPPPPPVSKQRANGPASQPHAQRLGGGYNPTPIAVLAKEQDFYDKNCTPPEYAEQGVFADTLRYAHSKEKYILVALLDRSAFLSSSINRDLLRKPLVRDFLLNKDSNFVLWEALHDSPQGAEVVGTYRRTGVPCMFIVDPITRAALQDVPFGKISSGKGFLDAQLLVSFLIDFAEVRRRERSDSFEFTGEPQKPKGEITFHPHNPKPTSQEAVRAPSEAPPPPPPPKVSTAEEILAPFGPKEGSSGTTLTVRFMLPDGSPYQVSLLPSTPAQVVKEALAAKTGWPANTISAVAGYPPKRILTEPDSFLGDNVRDNEVVRVSQCC